MSSDINPTVPPIVSSTNLGPLTTSTALPANCLDNLYDLQTYGLGYPWTYETQGCAISTCCPSNRFYTVGWGWFSSYFSPAVCPSQYKSCAPPATGLKTALGETIIFCCPDTYDCPQTSENGIRYWACASLLSTSTPVTILNGIFDQSFVSTRTFSLDPELGASYQVAYPIQIRFKQSQLTTTASEVFIGDFAPTTGSMIAGATSTTSSSATSSAASSKATTAPGNSNLADSHDSGGLSTGAKAGIGVGAALAALLIIGLSVWLVVMRRKHKRLQDRMSSTPGYPQPGEIKNQSQFVESQVQPYVAPRSELESCTLGVHQHRRTELP